jgi:glutamate 5-kinase
MISADCLLLLSDTTGLHTADPARDPAAVLVPEVHAVTPEVEAMAGGAATDMGSGGMVTKVAAGRIALAAGCHMAIASGRVRHPVLAVEEGAKCTWFIASQSPVRVRKQWIAGSLQPRGEIVVDDGAAVALAGGKSLLPAGVLRIGGEFERGDAVLIRDVRGVTLAHGLSAYGSADAARIVGLQSGEIEAVLGYRGREELVHRNDLAMVARHG